MLVSLCLLVSHEKTQSGTLTFHDVCLSNPLTFHNCFKFFASRRCFKHFFRFQATPLLQIRWGLKSEKVLETATRSTNMKPMWEVKGFEKHIMTTTDREGDTNRRTKSDNDTQDKQSHGQGHGHGTAQRMKAQKNKVNKQRDTQHKTARRTIARRCVIHTLLPSPFLFLCSSLSHPSILCFMFQKVNKMIPKIMSPKCNFGRLTGFPVKLPKITEKTKSLVGNHFGPHGTKSWC